MKHYRFSCYFCKSWKEKALFVFGILFLAFINFACANSKNCEIKTQTSKTVKIANWNLQTFFDANYDGIEYSGFTEKDKAWTLEKYTQRLERLCSILEQIDADIIAFEEIENSKIIYDIINNYNFQGRRDKSYNYACFAGESGQAFGVAILSRYPILDYTVHQIDVRGEVLSQPRMRPILKAFVQIGEKTVSFYVCHWKSKSGGEEASEIWRNFSENQLANLLSCDGNPYFIAGDFNRDLYEFNILSVSLSQGYTGCVEFGRENLSKLQTEKIKVNSAWLTINSSQVYKDEGTYYYQNEWEKLDHFFFSPTIELENFFTLKTDENLTENGTPFRYSVWNGKGYSDHFPIICIVNF